MSAAESFTQRHYTVKDYRPSYPAPMQPHQLIIPDEADYRQLLRIVDAAGLQVAADGTVTKKATKPKRSREELVAIIRRGGDGLSIADPLAWQREQRDDSDLPFHVLETTPAE